MKNAIEIIAVSILLALLPLYAVQAGGQAATQSGSRKQINDVAEYNAYVAAVQTADVNAKIKALEGFLRDYPNTVVRVDALQMLMSYYQQKSDFSHMEDAAKDLLVADPKNLRALFLLTYTKTNAFENNENPQQGLSEAVQYARRGLDALGAPVDSSAIFSEKDRALMQGTFNKAIGLDALLSRNLATARSSLRVAVDAQPTDLSSVYPLALAYLSDESADRSTGLFYIARAAELANGTPAQQQLEGYGKNRYVEYHGSDQGWADLLSVAENAPAPPADLNIARESKPRAHPPSEPVTQTPSFMSVFVSALGQLSSNAHSAPGPSEPSHTGQTTQGSSNSQSPRYTPGSTQCVHDEYTSGQLWFVNSCTVALHVAWTSDSGNSWGSTDVGPNSRQMVSAAGVGYTPKDGRVYLFACAQGGTPVMLDGSEIWSHTYKGQFKCHK